MIHFISILAQTETMQPTEISFGWLFLKMILAMVFVIGAAIIVLKYVLPKLNKHQMKTRNIHILDRISLEPRKNLYVVRIKDKAVVVGVSDNGVSKVMDVDLKDWEESQS